MELKNRNEMDKKYMWDLTHIFKTDEEWEKAFSEVNELIETISDLQGQLDGCPNCLKRVMDTLQDIEEKLERVGVYAFLTSSGDNGNSENQAKNQRVTQLATQYSSAVSFLEPEILAIPKERFESEYLPHEALKEHKHMIENINRKREHTLDAQREKMLAMLGEVSGGASTSYDMLSEVDMCFPTIKDDNGNDVELSHGRFGALRESKNYEVRKAAFEGFLGEFKKYSNTISSMYANSVKFDKYMAQVRNYGSSIEAALSASNVPVAVYDSLVGAVHDKLPAMERYLALRKRVLGLDEISLFDLYCPMVDDVDFSIDYSDAKTLVKEALKPMGERYGKLLDKAYNEAWIDVYENRGKTTGAYSCGVYGVHPYVLLNYQSKLDDAFTLAHELGHAMHSYLSSENQGLWNSNYLIFVAEVASTVNEVMLAKYLLKIEKDKKRRAYILNHFLEGFRTTVFRQTLFAEFERKTHEMAEAGEPLTPVALNGLYHDLNALYYKGARIDEIMDYEWSFVSHFYRAFYVYQYATGYTSAVALATKILETGDASSYIEFLSSGDSDYPMNVLKKAGVDLTTPEPIKKALDVFDSAVTELSELMTELGK